MIEEPAGNPHVNMASIDSEFTSVNNKNNRKLKRIDPPAKGGDPPAFIEDNNFMNSQSFSNDNNDSGLDGERRAKSSLGHNQSSEQARIRNKVAKNASNISAQNSLMLVNQMRGTSSSAMARIHQ
jgi:hypothetical protein